MTPIPDPSVPLLLSPSPRPHPHSYYKHSPQSTKNGRLVIFLEGGGGCVTESECVHRNNTTPRLTSSNRMPAVYAGATLLSDSGVFAGADLLAAHYSTVSQTSIRRNPTSIRRQCPAILYCTQRHAPPTARAVRQS